MNIRTAGIAAEKAHYSFDILYNYIIPEDFPQLQVGMRVLIPFGRGNKKCLGIIMSLSESAPSDRNIKKISSLYDREPILNKEQLELVLWLKENYFCTYFDALKLLIPPKLGQIADKNIGMIRLKDSYLESLDTENKEINETTLFVPTPKQQKVIDLLLENDNANISEICYLCGVTPAVIKNLEKKNIAESYNVKIFRSPCEISSQEPQENPDSIVFSPSQQKVYDGLKELLYKDTVDCALLRGITGSGKTSVFIRLISDTIKRGKTAMLLVPEIALTPQITNRFISLFGRDVAIIHSGLSLGERSDEYIRIKTGAAKIVIGTRSAVFSPLENIGIIIMDEEGEHSYKSDRTPRYHARDVAKLRAVKNNSLLLLASATPSLTSYHFGKTGRYKLFELDERFNNAVLPDVYLVDMKAEAEKGNRESFSEVLLHEIGENLKKGEQTLILLNRRGYHTYMNCIRCGYVYTCENCAIPLTYHKTNDNLHCHYCGYSKKMTNRCEKCGSNYIHQSGTGTQKIEDILTAFFPDAKILRMDADTTMSKYSYQTKFQQFKDGEFNIMVGTQMIAKGLDFENVTLVGVLNIDKSLYSGDYLGYERTFSLITQVVGRSGRGEKKGRAYLQTFSPDHYVLMLGAAQNYVGFYEEEISIRKELIFPPFCDIFMLVFSSTNEPRAEKAAKRFIEIFRNYKSEINAPYRLLGPTKGGVGNVNGKYRYKLILKAKNCKAIRRILENALRDSGTDPIFRDIGVYVDINGDII